MQGTKRLASLDSTSGLNDASVSRKRMIGALERKASETPANSEIPLDLSRAALSRHHVRTLNSQFASWVQTQLADHPDEFWEDGVNDYISHARDIMEKFSDVVNWLKANATKKATVDAQSKATFSFDKPQKEKCDQVPSTNIANSTFGWSSTPSSTNQSTLLLTNAHSSSVLPSSNLGTGLYSSSQNALQTSSGSSFGLFSSFSQSSATSSGSQFGLFSNHSTVSSLNTQSSLSQGSGTSSGLSFGFFSNYNTSSTLNTQSSSSQSSGTSIGSSFGLLNNHSTVASLNTQSSLCQSSGATFSFGSLPSFQTSLTPLFGQNSQGSVPNTQTDANDDDELPQPSSPSLKKSEEKGIITVHEVKCKVYVKASDPSDKDTWKDKGTGQLVLKCKEGVSKGTKESKPTIVIRNDAGKVLLNALLYPGIKTNVQKNSIVAIFHTAESDSESSNVVARTYLLRTKSTEERSKLQTMIDEYAPNL